MRKAHIAAEAVFIDGLCLQRCAHCGELLRSIAYSADRNPGDLAINYLKGTLVIIDNKEKDALTRVATYAMGDDFTLTNEISTTNYPKLDGCLYCWD